MGSITSICFAAPAVPVPAAAPVVVKVPLDTRTIASKESVQTVFTKREIIAPVKAAVVVPIVVPVPAPVVRLINLEKKETIANTAEKAAVTVIPIKPRDAEKDKEYLKIFQGVRIGEGDYFSVLSRNPTPEASGKDRESIKPLRVEEFMSKVAVQHDSSRASRDISLLNTVTYSVEYGDLMQDTPINSAAQRAATFTLTEKSVAKIQPILVVKDKKLPTHEIITASRKESITEKEISQIYDNVINFSDRSETDSSRKLSYTTGYVLY